jgi:hypothetical protein
MRSRTFAVIGLVTSLGFSSVLCAQQAKTKAPSLGEIIERLTANLKQYDSSTPSLFCDEHVIASQSERGGHDERTVIDSVFRLKRTPNPDRTATLIESREIRSVDGKGAISQELDGPTLLNGAFEGGFAVVSVEQAACMNYKLQRTNSKRTTEPYVVRFATVLTPRSTTHCLLQESSTGRVSIDPASMQIKHIELTTPHHVIIPRSSDSSDVVGKRVLTIDYSPVPLGGATFWMPSRITMRNTGSPGTFHEVVWSFQAIYRNYHKTEVTSRILPSSEAPEQ